MANKHTKKALFLSMLSILLCLSMLVGSTFAWFTDTASTGVNTIVAGNLDIELEYSKDLNTWSSVEGTSELFRQNTLWEPGHTEVVYLRLTNAGTLAADCDLFAFAAAQTEGVNAKDEKFKLSDVLKFAVQEHGAVMPTALDRDSARLIACSSDNTVAYALGDRRTLEKMASKAVHYYTMVVYMPTEADNDHNHKTGTKPPQIDLKITLEATQADVESDSFGPDYDKDANGTPDHPEFGSDPETVETKQGAIPTNVSEDDRETVMELTDVNIGGVTVTYPENALVDEHSEKETGISVADATQGMVYTGNTSQNGITAVSGTALEVYELTLPVSESNTVAIKVEKMIGAQKKIIGLYHNKTQMTAKAYVQGEDPFAETDSGYYTYDAESGKLTMWVLHASEIAMQVKVAATINGIGYSSFEAALAEAKPGATITLNEDIALQQTATLDQDITIDGAGHVVSGKDVQAIDGRVVGYYIDGGNVTLRNMILTDFDLGNVSLGTVIRVNSGNAHLRAEGLTINNFTRDCFTILSGTFEVVDCNIDCSLKESGVNQMRKGFNIQGENGRVKGIIKNTHVTNAGSTYSKWISAAIEVYQNADIEIEGSKIDNCNIGIYLDNTNNGGDSTITIRDTVVEANEYASYIMGGNSDNKEASLIFESGDFSATKYCSVGLFEYTERDHIIIKGGNFHNYVYPYYGTTYPNNITISGGNFYWLPSEWTEGMYPYIAEGYQIVYSEGYCSVVPK